MNAPLAPVYTPPGAPQVPPAYAPAAPVPPAYGTPAPGTPYGAPAAPPAGPDPRRVKLHNVRVSHWYGIEGKLNPKTGVLEKTTSLLIPKSEATWNMCQVAINAAKAKKWPHDPTKWADCSLRDGDLPAPRGKPRGPECKNHWVLNTGTPNGRELEVRRLDGSLITNPHEVKSGDYVHCSITFYGSDNDNNTGVWASLNNVIFVRPGEALASSNMMAEDEWSDEFVTGSVPQAQGATRYAAPMQPYTPAPAVAPHAVSPGFAAPQPAMAPPGLVLTAKAAGASLQSFYDGGWTDDQLVLHGYAVRAVAAAPAAPPPPSVPATPAGLVMTTKAAGASLQSFYQNGWTDEALVSNGYAVPHSDVPY